MSETPKWMAEADQRYMLEQNNPQESQNQEELGLLGTIGDIAAAPFRGIAGAAEGILELPTIFGLDYDIPDNLGLGSSETFAGGLVEGISQFAVGFAGTGGMATARAIGAGIGKGGKIGRLLAGGPKRAEILGAGVQGVAVDFGFFEGQGGRLSDLIESHPGLANPITEFLASDPNDSEAMARFKNAIEGFGLGMAFDSLIVALRGKRAGEAVLRETGDPQKALAAQVDEMTVADAQMLGAELGTDDPEVALAASLLHQSSGVELGAISWGDQDFIGPKLPPRKQLFQLMDGREVEGTDAGDFYSPMFEAFENILYDRENTFNLGKGFLRKPAKELLGQDGAPSNQLRKVVGKMKGPDGTPLKINALEWEYSGISTLIESNPEMSIGEALRSAERIKLWVVDKPGPKFEDSFQLSEIGASRTVRDKDGMFVTAESDQLQGRLFLIGSADQTQMSPHSRYPDVQEPHFTHNGKIPLFHIRTNTRTFIDANGVQKKVVHVEEMQSDWQIAANQARRQDAEIAAASGFTQPSDGRELPGASKENHIRLERWDPSSRSMEVTGEHALPEAAPFVADHKGVASKDWIRLGIRKILKWAADNEYDGVSFITGDQNARRWQDDPNTGVYKKVKTIEAEGEDIFMRNESGEVVGRFNVADANPEDVEELLGSSLAYKIGKLRETVGAGSDSRAKVLLEDIDVWETADPDIRETLGSYDFKGVDWVTLEFHGIEVEVSAKDAESLFDAIEAYRMYGAEAEWQLESALDEVLGIDLEEVQELISKSIPEELRRITLDTASDFGGEWSRNLYDKTVGGMNKKEAKRLGLFSTQARLSQTAEGEMNPVFLFTSESEKVLSNPQPMLQGTPGTAKGMAQIFQDGKAIVRGLKNPDVSTAVHEIGHVVRHHMYMGDALTKEQKGVLDEWAGAKKGVWDTNAEEKFARGFELYVREGKLPEGASPILRQVFDVLSAAMAKIYQKITGSSIDIKMSKEVREVFDAIVTTRDLDEVLYQQRKLARQERGGKVKTLFQEGENPNAKTDKARGQGAAAEKALRDKYGSLENAPKAELDELKRIVRNDPDFVPFDSKEAEEFLGHDTRPKPSPLKGDKNRKRPGKLNVGKSVENESSRDLVDQMQQDIDAAPSTKVERDAQAAEAIQYLREILPTMDVEEASMMLEGVGDQYDAIMSQMMAIRQVHADYMSDMGEVLTAIRDMREAGKQVPDSMIAKAMWLEGQASTLTRFVQSNNGRIGSSLADLRNIPKHELSFNPKDPEASAKFLKNAKEEGADIEKWLDQRISAFEAGDFALARVTHEGGKSRFGRIISELYYNSLLSGPRTQSVNALSNALNMFFTPLERAFGAAFTPGAKIADEIGHFTHLISAAGDALRVAGISYRKGASQLDPSARTLVDAQGMNKGKLDLNLKDPAANMVANWIYHRTTMPTRMLGAVDEFMKQVNYRAHVKQGLASKAASMGLNGSQAAKWIDSKFEMMLGQGQLYSKAEVWRRGDAWAKEKLKKGGLEPTKDRVRNLTQQYVNRNWDDDMGELAKESLENAREVTFTQANRPQLGHNPVSKGVQWMGAEMQKVVNKAPIFRIVTPFINTPTNLVSFYLDRQLAPIVEGIYNPLRAAMGKEIYGSPKARAGALGRIATGTAMGAMTVSWVMNGKITGGGPKDPAQRQAWINAGHQPYSIRVGDKFYSYARLDPYASFFGVIADLSEGLGSASATDDTSMAEDIMVATLGAFMRNIGQKTYLQGFTRLAKVIDDPDTYGDSYIRGLLGAAIPTMAAQLNQDPYFREIRSLTDQWKSRIPGYSETLAPRRNVLGEPMKRSGYASPTPLLEPLSPFQKSELTRDPVAREIARLGHGFSPPQAIKHGVLDLQRFENNRGQTAYDRWQEITSEIKIGGRTLRDALGKTIESPAYERMIDAVGEEQSPKVQALKVVIRKYRDKAYTQMLTEFDQVAKAEKQLRINKVARRVGRESQVVNNILNF